MAILPHDRICTQALHFTSATVLFLTLVFFCYLFTKGTTKGEQTKRKRRRNWVYRVCGGLMVVCLIALFIYFRLRDPVKPLGSPIAFGLETAML